MRSRRHVLWQKVVAFVPLLLLLASLPAQVLLRCRGDGQLRSVCCCPSDAEARSDSGPPVAASDCCCQREIAGGGQLPPLELRRNTNSLIEAPVLVALASPLPAGLFAPAAEVSPGARGFDHSRPPRPGPSIVVLKHAFLI